MKLMQKIGTIWIIKCLLLLLFIVFMNIIIFNGFLNDSITIKPSTKHLIKKLRSAFKKLQNINDIEETENKIDWHDWRKIQEESKRIGQGEFGIASFLPSLETRKEEMFNIYGYNAALSEFISVNRSIPDLRHLACWRKKYLKNLDSVSVIVSFHNEHFSTLLRTCWSVINRSPASLLKEIILVDDASTKIELKTQLDDYISKNLTKVRIIRLEKRGGLVRGRLAGAKKAKGKILVFLDSHIEANVNWLPPLLEPIAKNYKTCVCPVVDVIDFETFEYRAQVEEARGTFDWQLFFRRLPSLSEDLKKSSEPFMSPVMTVGVFAISAKFFWQLGGYDPGLVIWGGEQFELSFKIWLCGGEIYDVPCSRIGHINIKTPLYKKQLTFDYLGRNYKRVAEVWMDEYAEILYDNLPYLRSLDPGNLGAQKALRKKLQCKPFKWYMEYIESGFQNINSDIVPNDTAIVKQGTDLLNSSIIPKIEVNMKFYSNSNSKDVQISKNPDIKGE